ncbi:hypothetical protein LXL04_020831 [Taraxacum kok-saghyz]
MASPHHPATMEKLPGDVLTNIFIRLLAKQLAQMKCVSKSLNAFISEPAFVKSHLQHSTQNNDGVLLVFYDLFSFGNEHSRFTAHPSRLPHLQVSDFIKPPVSPQCILTCDYRVIGSVNGLVCFSHNSPNDSVIHIWNPSLSAVSTLPQCSTPFYSSTGSIEAFLGFGFDPEIDDYKVVKLTCYLRPPNNDSQLAIFFGNLTHVAKEWLQTEVYSMRKGFWEVIPEKPSSNITRIRDQDKVFVDGHHGYLHWLGYIDEERNAQRILAFDLGAETFSEIPLPSSLVDYNMHPSYLNVLGVLSKKLCLMRCGGDGACEVWVMDEYGVAESWVKQHVFSLFNGIGPIGFTLQNEFLFEAYNTRLVMYDPVEAKCKSFKIMARICGNVKVVEYVDSLVWVAAPFEHEISCSISELSIF